MNGIEFENGAFTVDAAIVAESFGLDASSIQARMREGKITSRCERGVDEDAGRYRLTFFHEHQRLRLIVDAQGNVLERVTERISPARARPQRTR